MSKCAGAFGAGRSVTIAVLWFAQVARISGTHARGYANRIEAYRYAATFSSDVEARRRTFFRSDTSCRS